MIRRPRSPCEIVSLDAVCQPGFVFRREGAFVNSPGCHPRVRDRPSYCFLLSPEGAAVTPGATVAPSGLKKKTASLAFPGLTPRAIGGRPFRAEESQRTSETILPGGGVE